MLCVRPIVLHQVRQKFQVTGGESTNVSPMVQRLTQTCEEAASRSLRILAALQQRRLIARFGFFDLDATFSAAFVLIMLKANNKESEKPPEDVYQACQILEYLSDSGNRAARRRLQDIRLFCARIWSVNCFANVGHGRQESSVPIITRIGEIRDCHIQMDGSLHSAPTTHARQGPSGSDLQSPSYTRHAGQPNRSTARYHPREAPHSHLPQQSIELPAADITTDQDGSTYAVSAHESIGSFTFSDIEKEMLNEADGIYSCFNDPDLPLTGIDDADWTEMSRIFGTGHEL